MDREARLFVARRGDCRVEDAPAAPEAVEPAPLLEVMEGQSAPEVQGDEAQAETQDESPEVETSEFVSRRGRQVAAE